jgi:hypothetical protein
VCHFFVGIRDSNADEWIVEEATVSRPSDPLTKAKEQPQCYHSARMLPWSDTFETIKVQPLQCQRQDVTKKRF